MEADLEGLNFSSVPFYVQANEHSCRPESLAEHVQTQHPSQLQQTLRRQFLQRPQDDLFALPTLEEAAWSEYLQDAHLWKCGDPFSDMAQRRASMIQPLSLPVRTRQEAWAFENKAPHPTGSSVDNHNHTAPQMSRRPTDLEQQVLLEIISRLNAQGACIDKDTLTVETMKQVIAAHATPVELAVIQDEQQAYKQELIEHDPHQSTKMDLKDQPDQADISTQENLWVANYREELSPTRLADGGSNQFHDKHNRRHLRTKCFPCYSTKRKCDRERQADAICSQCTHQASLFPDIYDPNKLCVVDETQEYKEFKDVRAVFHSRAKSLGDDDWLAKRQRRQDRKAEEKQKKGNVTSRR